VLIRALVHLLNSWTLSFLFQLHCNKILQLQNNLFTFCSSGNEISHLRSPKELLPSPEATAAAAGNINKKIYEKGTNISKKFIKKRLEEAAKDVSWLLLKFLTRVTEMVTDADAGCLNKF
jgi:hypothetical protein